MKQTTDPKNAIENDAIENDAIENEEQREAYRYIFNGDQRLSMIFKQQSVEVINISAGGMAFRGKGFTRYDVDQINLFLDIPNYPGDASFSARLRILDITDNGICHCIFENCTIEKYEMIHKYVLEMQKKNILTHSKIQMK